MTKKLKLTLLLVLLVTMGCSTVMLTGRKQLLLYPDSEVDEMSALSYGEFLSENELSTNKSEEERVKRIGEDIAQAVEEYMTQNGMAEQAKSFKWEFNLVKSQEVNAWCMPGGKVVFYEGILPICKNDDGIAVVMGHEIAHAVAKHSNERMSQQALLSAGGAVAMSAISDKPALTQSIASAAIGLGSQYGVVLPFSRKHEYEADHLGMIFMTMAGYNPEEAITFWQRMSQLKDGNEPLEFTSTHPADANRVEALKGYLQEMEKYKKN